MVRLSPREGATHTARNNASRHRHPFAQGWVGGNLARGEQLPLGRRRDRDDGGRW